MIDVACSVWSAASNGSLLDRLRLKHRAPVHHDLDNIWSPGAYFPCRDLLRRGVQVSLDCVGDSAAGGEARNLFDAFDASSSVSHARDRSSERESRTEGALL